MQIEQIDRDAAAKALGYATWEDATDYRNSGEEDRRVAHMAQAFARHRLASLSARPAVGEDVVERVDFHEKLDTYLIEAGLHHRVTLDDALRIVRAAIAAMGSADMGKGGGRVIGGRSTRRSPRSR